MSDTTTTELADLDAPPPADELAERADAAQEEADAEVARYARMDAELKGFVRRNIAWLQAELQLHGTGATADDRAAANP